MPSVTQRFKNEPFDKMLRRFKNKCERAGIVAEVRKREEFIKPSAKKHKKNQEMKRSVFVKKLKEQRTLERMRIMGKRPSSQ